MPQNTCINKRATNLAACSISFINKWSKKFYSSKKFYYYFMVGEKTVIFLPNYVTVPDLVGRWNKFLAMFYTISQIMQNCNATDVCRSILAISFKKHLMLSSFRTPLIDPPKQSNADNKGRGPGRLDCLKQLKLE